MKPVIKWVGGKTQLLPDIVDYLPESYSRYLEPFLGGAAVLLHLEPEIALVNDLNKDLINMYKVVKSYPAALINKLEEHERKLSEEYYYFVRSLDRDPGLENLNHIYRASRFIFLNKSGFNGLYRVNLKGQVNVPFGKKEYVNTFDKENIYEVSRYLSGRKIEMFNEDYRRFILNNVKENDFVYLDPPYDPVSDTASFTAYQQNGFSRENQKELRDVCIEIHNRGGYFMLSNSSTDFIKEIYTHPKFNIHRVNARRSINSDGKGRGEVLEVLITNY